MDIDYAGELRRLANDLPSDGYVLHADAVLCDDAADHIESLEAEVASLKAEVERLKLVAEMVELRSLMGEVREGDPDKDDGGRQIVINLISLRDEFDREANDAAAARAVVVQDGLSFIHRLVRQQNAMLGEKLQRLSAAGSIAVREPRGEEGGG